MAESPNGEQSTWMCDDPYQPQTPSHLQGIQVYMYMIVPELVAQEAPRSMAQIVVYIPQNTARPGHFLENMYFPGSAN